MGSTTKKSGTITTENLVPAGTATAGSAVEVSTNGDSGMSIQVTGTYTGALSVQGTIDGTNWVTLGGTPIVNVNSGAKTATIASAATGIFNVNVSGLLKARITALAAVTGTATVSVIVTDQAGVFFLASEVGGGGGDVSYSDNPATFTGDVLEIAHTAPDFGVGFVVNEAGFYSRVLGHTDTSAFDITLYNSGGGAPNELDFNSSGDMVFYPGDGAGLWIALRSGGMEISGLVNYADDAAAATGGVPVNGLYRTGSALKIRVA